MLIGIWTYRQGRSSATLHLGNIPVEETNQVKVFLNYTPRKPKPFFSKRWNVLGGSFIKQEIIKPDLIKVDKRSFSFSFRPKLTGISAYELTSITINCHLPEGKTISFYTDITLDTLQNDQQGWIEGQSMQENNGIARLMKVEFKSTTANFRDHSKDEFYRFYEKEQTGELKLDEENRPILLEDSLPNVREYLHRSLPDNKE